MTKQNQDDDESGDTEVRRGFLYKFVTVLCGGIVGIVPLLAGLAVFIDPAKRRRDNAGADADVSDFVRVTSLQSIPADGVPRQFPVIADQRDAWTYFPNQRIGSVFLRRVAEDQPVQCFTSICPHAGCSIGYSSDSDTYTCPCHNSQFALDGEPIPPTPSPRGLDPLEVDIGENGDVRVKYVSYYTGKHERKQR